jgi:GT2 family glycosyltransferase/glycosyltransferase involved in cell wall biosynthesis
MNHTAGKIESGDFAQSNQNSFGKTVDVVICVYNALEHVRHCLESVAMNCPRGYTHLYIVNDGSREDTSKYLREFCRRCDFATLIESSRNEGYTRSANKGLRASTADYVILLNSDTIVPERWIRRIIECGESDERIGIVGPLSNAASYQSVPDIRTAEGDWAVNALPDGVTVDDMAAKVYELSEKSFPRASFVNGSCYAIKREVIEAIGYFDEELFPIGYGEENDYSIRARDAGFQLAVADHAYVYHAKSRSFGHGRRRELALIGRQALEGKYGPEKAGGGVDALESHPSLQRLRYKLRDFVESCESREALPEVRGMRVLYLLRGKAGSGGVHSIYQESSGMRKFGVYTEIALPRGVEESYRRFYPNAPEGLFHFYTDERELFEHAASFHVVVATIFTTVRALQRLYERAPHIVPAYYVQDYEPWIIRDPQRQPELVREAEESYTAIADMVCFAKTDWIRETVFEHHGTKVHKVRPSLDTTVYYADRMKKSKTGPVHIVAMVRPTTPRRAAKETMELLRTIQRRYPDKVRITIFGNDPASPDFLALPRDFVFENRGILVREEVADLLGSADVFVDLSVYQAFGRTGLEAMAVGCATVLPARGGVYEYAENRKNALIVDTANMAECVAALEELVNNGELRRLLKKNGLETASRFSVRSAVVSELKVFQAALAERRKRRAQGGA